MILFGVKKIRFGVRMILFGGTKFGVKKIRFGVRLILFGVPKNPYPFLYILCVMCFQRLSYGKKIVEIHTKSFFGALAELVKIVEKFNF